MKTRSCPLAHDYRFRFEVSLTNLEVYGDLVSKLKMEIIGITVWLIGDIRIRTKSP